MTRIITPDPSAPFEQTAPQTQFTPWTYSRVVSGPSPNFGDAIVSDPDGNAVCRVLAGEAIWDTSRSTADKSKAIQERDERAYLIAQAPAMFAALQAIVARIHGEFDHPALLKYGALSVNTTSDCDSIARSALSAASGKGAK